MYTRCQPITSIFQKAILLKDSKCNAITNRQLHSESLVIFSKIENKLKPLKRCFSGAPKNRDFSVGVRRMEGVGFINKNVPKKVFIIPKFPREMVQPQFDPTINKRIQPRQIQNNDFHFEEIVRNPGSLVKFPNGTHSDKGNITIVIDKAEICSSSPKENVTIHVTTTPTISSERLINRLSSADLAKVCSTVCSCCQRCEEFKKSVNPKLLSVGPNPPLLQPSNKNILNHQRSIPALPEPMINEGFLSAEMKPLHSKRSRSMEDFRPVRKLVLPTGFDQMQPNSGQLAMKPIQQNHENEPVHRGFSQGRIPLIKFDNRPKPTTQSKYSSFHMLPSQNMTAPRLRLQEHQPSQSGNLLKRPDFSRPKSIQPMNFVEQGKMGHLRLQRNISGLPPRNVPMVNEGFISDQMKLSHSKRSRSMDDSRSMRKFVLPTGFDQMQPNIGQVQMKPVGQNQYPPVHRGHCEGKLIHSVNCNNNPKQLNVSRPVQSNLQQSQRYSTFHKQSSQNKIPPNLLVQQQRPNNVLQGPAQNQSNFSRNKPMHPVNFVDQEKQLKMARSLEQRSMRKLVLPAGFDQMQPNIGRISIEQRPQNPPLHRGRSEGRLVPSVNLNNNPKQLGTPPMQPNVERRRRYSSFHMQSSQNKSLPPLQSANMQQSHFSQNMQPKHNENDGNRTKSDQSVPIHRQHLEKPINRVLKPASLDISNNRFWSNIKRDISAPKMSAPNTITTKQNKMPIPPRNHNPSLVKPLSRDSNPWPNFVQFGIRTELSNQLQNRSKNKFPGISQLTPRTLILPNQNVSNLVPRQRENKAMNRISSSGPPRPMRENGFPENSLARQVHLRQGSATQIAAGPTFAAANQMKGMPQRMTGQKQILNQRHPPQVPLNKSVQIPAIKAFPQMNNRQQTNNRFQSRQPNHQSPPLLISHQRGPMLTYMLNSVPVPQTNFNRQQPSHSANKGRQPPQFLLKKGSVFRPAINPFPQMRNRQQQNFCSPNDYSRQRPPLIASKQRSPNLPSYRSSLIPVPQKKRFDQRNSVSAKQNFPQKQQLQLLPSPRNTSSLRRLPRNSLIPVRKNLPKNLPKQKIFLQKHFPLRQPRTTLRRKGPAAPYRTLVNSMQRQNIRPQLTRNKLVGLTRRKVNMSYQGLKQNEIRRMNQEELQSLFPVNVMNQPRQSGKYVKSPNSPQVRQIPQPPPNNCQLFPPPLKIPQMLQPNMNNFNTPQIDQNFLYQPRQTGQFIEHPRPLKAVGRPYPQVFPLPKVNDVSNPEKNIQLNRMAQVHQIPQPQRNNCQLLPHPPVKISQMLRPPPVRIPQMLQPPRKNQIPKPDKNLQANMPRIRELPAMPLKNSQESTVRPKQLSTRRDKFKGITPKNPAATTLNPQVNYVLNGNAAVLFYAPGKLKLVSEPVPHLTDEKGVIVKMLYVYLTDTDAQMLASVQDGPYKLTQPSIAGKSGSGVIVEVGKQVENVKIGDKVALKPVSCGKCSACQSSNVPMCERVPLSERFGILKRFHAHPAKFVTKLPEKVNPIDGAMMDELSCAIRACKKSAVTAGDNVLVLDGGSLGLWTALAAKSMGATNVCLADPRTMVLDQAKKLGIDRTFLLNSNSSIKNSSANISEYLVGDNPRIVFDCSGSPLTNQIAVNTAKSGGKVVLMKNAGSNQPIVLSDAVDRGIDILSSQHGNDDSERAALQFLASGKVQLNGVNSRFFDISNVHEAFRLLNSGTTTNIFVQLNRLDDENKDSKKS